MSSPIIFLHGFPFNSSSWDLQVQHLCSKTVCHAPDLRGHRNGPRGPGPWMLHDFAEDLKALMDREKIEKATLCGVSMGGYIAQHFVQQYPARVSALILSNTRADADSNEAKDKRFATLEKLRLDGLKPFAAEFSKAVLGETTLKSKPQLQPQIEAMILSNQAGDVGLNLAVLASRRDNTANLPQIKCPVLVIAGAEDKVIPLEFSQVLAKQIPRAKLHVIEGAGHLPNLEQPDAFNSQVDQFLASMN